MILDARADVAISFLTNVNTAVLLAARKLPVPVIVSERIHPPLMPTGRLRSMLRRISYPWATRVVMLTAQSQQWLTEHIPSAVSTVIPNPVQFPLPVASPRVAPESFIVSGQKLMLGVGRLDRQKGFDVLIDVFSSLADMFPDWALAIVGEGSERPALSERAAALGLGGRFHLVGRVGNVAEWYQRADLFVLSSRFEGFPNSLVEAMSYGCCVVSMNCQTGPADIIANGINGALVSSFDELRSRLSELMGNAHERARLGAHARDIRERYALERIVNQWESLFQEVGCA